MTGSRETGFVAEPGERVLFLERREPPIMQVGIAIAFVLSIIGMAAQSRAIALAFVLLAVAVLAVARQWKKSKWMTDYAITDRRIAVVERSAGNISVPIDTVHGVSVRGGRATFATDRGDVQFSYIRSIRTMQKRLERDLPGIPIELEWDPLCRT